MDNSLLALCGRVLRDPEALVEGAADRATFAWLAPRLVLVAAACAMVLGAVAGSYRGGLQIGFAAIKMPLVLLVPLLAAVPAARALYGAANVDLDPARLAAAGLVGVARTALVAAGLAPVLWLAYSMGIRYHLAVVLLAGVLVVAGLPGLRTVVAAMPRVRLAAWGTMALLGLLTAQTGWVLRPFVARPRADVALLRPLEGNIAGTLLLSPLASMDIYLRYEPTRSPWRDGEGGE